MLGVLHFNARNRDSVFLVQNIQAGKALASASLQPQQVDMEITVFLPGCSLPSPVLDRGAWKSL